MKLWMRFVAAAALALLPLASVAAQPQSNTYHPLMNQEMVQSGTWHQWVTTFNELSAKQKAEVMRRHISMCLEAFQLTDDQRSFVKEVEAKFVTEDAYGADPEKKAALHKEMQPMQDHGMTLLGRELYIKFFVAKPPISVLEAVKNDPAFR